MTWGIFKLVFHFDSSGVVIPTRSVCANKEKLAEQMLCLVNLS